jgi:hypothetical protein
LTNYKFIQIIKQLLGKTYLAAVVFLCLQCAVLNSQNKNEIKVVFQPFFGSYPLILDSTYVFENGQIEFSTLKFYISNLQFLKNEKIVFKESNSFHLFDASNIKSQNFTFTIPKGLLFTELNFNFGIDSLTNISGAMGGDLDPTKGMYWTWQSGYVNFKIEGTSSLCNNKRQEFQYHLGGYQFPFSALQKISLEVEANNTLFILVDVKKIMETFDLSSLDHIMSPSAEAVRLSYLISQCFSVK